ncbi:DUF262 domain-containing protein [Nocardia brasiliensis]|uniref:DUF262 domain-containing protein n=1 Tax=Nocardia brasiliensis TaxID=37326 RepID=UPI0024579C8F|nr:DUF262 domain-containing protein [Nocardia brasiliensis]
MQGSTPQHYTIADFLKWNDDKELILNPAFQRGPVWASPARSYLIDSLLRGYPIPKLLLRTTVDRDSRRTIRDVVDGQQRLRTIIDFAANRLVLGPKAGDFRGKKYSDLEDEEKDAFLAYKLTCEQLINASDSDVLEVFLRINSYAVPVNGAELRNAKYDNPFSTVVKDTVRQLQPVWELGVLGNRDRVRMVDQSVVAELFGFLQDGVLDGDEGRLNRIYEQFSKTEENDLPSQAEIVSISNETAALLSEFPKEPIVARPHFLMMAASVMYARGRLPEGKLRFANAPARETMLRNVEDAVERLREINVNLARSDQDEIPPSYANLIEAKTSTQRVRSRQVRFEYFTRALAGLEPRSRE